MSLRTCLHGFLFLALLLVVPAPASAVEIPDPPEQQPFLDDRAELLSASGREAVEDLQERALRRHGTHIAVVTVESMAHYEARDSLGIEGFTRLWLAIWRPALHPDRRTEGRDMLLMVSRDDRKAWVQADRAWNDDLWSPHLQQIMDVRVLPEFARGAFETGLRAGLEELIATAAIGPEGEPPRAVGVWHERLHVSPWVTTPFALGTVLWFVVPGVLCLLLAALLPRNRAALSKIGAGLIVVGALFWVALALLAAWGVYRYMPPPAAPPPGARSGSAGGGFGGGFGGGGGGGGGGAGGGGGF
ncbi:YgcG family protein [Thioalkalivibrio sp. ALJ24]|uniref:TPM domain-containing protein n=1 Tax=Thioalkalivibrio sp. ALJ24 TaxID=545276 RepID=UPI00036E915C|nr:TPM domain-containing protein [Thioalkalivibrio sp. ALJ24]